ncbi:hypothetical protein [Aureispira anguillae]|uniref:Uncharacterized protein n=1 Tax=Aureispira anguillae TaxID=2864201 RepID=A0A915YG99_9BACT|nr:hypothetical protein [Aureispira anguillae]BDS12548.1 hypothetical protein AsAng_0032710 [Aureispira anguillae]
MNSPKWKRTIARISLPQKRSIGFFKKKHSLLLTYSIEIKRHKTPLEIAIQAQHQDCILALQQLFPIVDEASPLISSTLLPSNQETHTLSSTLIVKDIEVSQRIFEQYKNQSFIPIQYNSQDPTLIQF